MSLDAELIIIGGGCAGLSLASRLAERDTHCPRIIILESRTCYTHDRTWCFWGHDALRATARLRHLIPHQWCKVRVSGHVRGSARTTIMDGGDHAYQMLPADVFYGDALRMIAKNNRIDLRLGHSIITEPVKKNMENTESKKNSLWQIETSHGLICGARIIDTRPARRPERGGALLWQSFYGQEIACAEPIFETEYVDLMDFLKPSEEQIAFTYVLPLSPYRALIEATVFGVDPLSPDALVVQLEAAIAQRLHGAAFSVVRSEHGILPMGMIPAAAVRSAPRSPLNHDLSYIKVGLTAGGARPATGYAFQRIQRWADLCESAIMEGKPLVTHPPDSLMLRLMDRLFLQVIRAHPALAPELFLLIFERVDPNRLIRFLSDRGTFADYIAIIWALPPGPFLGQIVSRIRGAFGLHQDQRHS